MIDTRDETAKTKTGEIKMKRNGNVVIPETDFERQLLLMAAKSAVQCQRVSVCSEAPGVALSGEYHLLGGFGDDGMLFAELVIEGEGCAQCGGTDMGASEFFAEPIQPKIRIACTIWLENGGNESRPVEVMCRWSSSPLGREQENWIDYGPVLVARPVEGTINAE
jgi:hypothetical protein